jgi:hypothetical protein
MTIARRRQEIRAMTNMTATYNVTAPAQPILNQQTTGVLGPHSVKAAPVSPRTGTSPVSFGYYSRRPNNEFARRNAIRTAKQTGNFPAIEPDEIGKSLTSGGTRQQKTYLAQAKEWFCSAAAPSHAVLDRTQNVIRQYANYLPNAFGIDSRTWSASVVETARWMCLEPADRAAEETSLTDLPSLVEKLDRPPEWTTARLIEDTASGLYHVVEGEFGSSTTAEQPLNATHQTIEEGQFKTSVAPASNRFEDITTQIALLPIMNDDRPCLLFDDLMKRVEGEFMLYGKPDSFLNQSIQGKIVVVSPVVSRSLGLVKNLLKDVFRNDDLLLATSRLQDHTSGIVIRDEIDMSDDGLLVANVSTGEDRECLGVHHSRCFVWDARPDYREVVTEIYQIALDTIERYPRRTVFVVTHSLAAAALMDRTHSRPGIAIRIEQLQSTGGA